MEKNMETEMERSQYFYPHALVLHILSFKSVSDASQ